MEQVSLFSPFGNTPEHEDRLTWAFLVVLKYDPSLQKFLRDLVESRLPPERRGSSHTWEPGLVSTQTSKIASPPRFLVSVLLTDVCPDVCPEEIKVEWSDRGVRYDGVVEYPNGLTLIIENKPSHGDVWKEQLSPSRKSLSSDVEVEDVELHESAICLEWSDILEGVLRYIHSGIPPFGSREIARDFLSFVEELHPELTPYRTFELCGDRPEALRRRVNLLIHDLIAEKENLEYGYDNRNDWPYILRKEKIAERIAFGTDSNSDRKKFWVRLWPADTVGQADRFFDAVNKSDFLNLEASHGWKVRPNLHFSFLGTQLIHSETRMGKCTYFNHFSHHRDRYRRESDMNTLATRAESWECTGLIGPQDRTKIRTEFIETNRNHINIIPGFEVSRDWDLEEVIELEKRGKLNAHILESLGHVLRTWNETL